MKNKAVNYIVRVMIQRGLGLFFYILGAWWTLNLRSIVYFCGYFGVTIVSCAVMFHINKNTLAERGKINTDSPKWDKILLAIYWLLSFFIIYLVAGMEAKQAPKVGIIFWIGMVLQLLVVAISLWALIENTYLESTARVQKDREQTVCETGPYSVIRHPTYSAILIWCISISMVFQTIGVAFIAVIIAIIIIARTFLEDHMLQEGLTGYSQYTKKVKYRLIPFIW